jgi:predicted DNA-binding transcriptional regulator AlpA
VARSTTYRDDCTFKPVKNDTLIGITEIGERFGVAKNTAWRWTRRPDFPAPAARLASGPVWRAADVDAWERVPRRPGPKPAGRP